MLESTIDQLRRPGLKNAGSSRPSPSKSPRTDGPVPTGCASNVAVTVSGAERHGAPPAPLRPPPLHPVNVDPGFAVAVNSPTSRCCSSPCNPRRVDSGRRALTSAMPVPAFCTVSVALLGGVSVKVAVTLVAAFMVTVQPPAPLQPPPLQPVKLRARAPASR